MYSSDEENNRNILINSDNEKSVKNDVEDDYILDFKEALKKDKEHNIKIVKSNSTTLNNLFRVSLKNSENNKDSKSLFSSNSLYSSSSFKKLKKSLNNEIKFDNFAEEKLLNFRDKILDFLETSKININQTYNNYIDFINKYISDNEKKMTKIIEEKKNNDNFISYVDNNIFKQIETIFEIQENIFDSISDNIKILIDFLNEFNLIFERNPLEKFINLKGKKIFDSFLFNKINYKKINLTNLTLYSNFNQNFKKFLFEKNEGSKSTSIVIKKDDKYNYNLESEYFKENYSNLEKIKFCNLPSFDILNLNNNKCICNKLLNIKFYDCKFNLYENENIQFVCPNLEKIKIKNCNFNMEFFLNFLNSFKLKEIYIKKCGLNDNHLNEFLDFLSNKKELVKSLENLSIIGNRITKFDLKNYFIDKELVLSNLLNLNLSNNNIYNFAIDNFKILPKIKRLDLTNNNFCTNILFSSIYEAKNEIKAIVIFNNNLFITNNEENNKIYEKYIFDKILNFEYKISYFDFTLFFNKNNNDLLNNIKFSSNIKISIKYLKLCFCALNASNMKHFLTNNYGLFNLKKLNLSNNFLTNEIFQFDFSCLEKLEIIDLSFNELEMKNLDYFNNFYNFIEKIRNLKLIKFQGNHDFQKDFFILLKHNFSEIKEKLIKIKRKNIRFIFELEFNGIQNLDIINLIEYKEKNL